MRDAAAEAISTLRQAQAIRSSLTGIKTSSDKARDGLDAMVEAVPAKLERIDSLIAEADDGRGDRRPRAAAACRLELGRSGDREAWRAARSRPPAALAS